MSATLLSVRDLSIAFGDPARPLYAVDGVSFDVVAGQVFGVVGESGSGKSLTMLAVMGLLPAGARIVAGEILFRGQDVLRLPAEQRRRLRGRDIGMVFQDPMMALNPVLRIGSQIAETLALHQPDLPRAARRDRVVELLGLVGVADPGRRARQYPHEFSGGMRQRAMIAMAIANNPALLIADEPTTALDVTIQAQVMALLRDLRTRTGAAMVLITHDLGLVAQAADRMGVMYGGRIVEAAALRAAFLRPAHPYTAALLASRPRLDGSVAVQPIQGAPPGLHQRQAGCVFQPRCLVAAGRAACLQQAPALRQVRRDQHAACHFAEETTLPALAPAAAREKLPHGGGALLEVIDLHKHFPTTRGPWLRPRMLRAVDGVSLTLHRGETLGLVGESGCGKSTLGRTILGLYRATGGRVALHGRVISGLSARARRPHRRRLQAVFQDPFASLDPSMSVHEIIAEPLRINRCYDAAQVAAMLEAVGLRAAMAQRRPAEFSGGQRQRIGIARAIALGPDVVVLDEPLSALDVSVQAQVVNLLAELQRTRGLAYLLIAHDLSVIRQIAHRVAVMYLGRIVETGPCAQVFTRPLHPYTRALLAAVPDADPDAPPPATLLSGELPDPAAPPSGCAFRTRCQLAEAICAAQSPVLRRHDDAPDHLAACHFAAALAAPASHDEGAQPCLTDSG